MALIPLDDDSTPSPHIIPLEDYDGKAPEPKAPKKAISTVLKEYVSKEADTGMKRALAAATGVMSLWTTAQKALSGYTAPILRKMGVPEGMIQTPEKAQSDFNAANAQDDINAQSDPIGIRASQLAGALLPGAMLPGGAAISGANIASKIAPGAGLLGKLAGASIGGAAEGAAYGGAITQPGQDPNQVINTQGAASGAVTGALLGPVQGAANSYLNRTEDYGKALQSLKLPDGTAYKGTVFNRDLDVKGTDFLHDMRKNFGNKILDSLPIVGTSGGRESQQINSQKYVNEWLNQLSVNTIGQSKKAIANEISKTDTVLKTTRQEMWGELWNNVPKGTKAYLSNSADDMSELLDSNKLLSNEKESLLKILGKGESIEPKDVHNLRQDVWGIRARLDKKLNLTTSEEDLLYRTQGLYGKLTDDLEESLQSAPDLVDKWQHANSFEKEYQNMFNAKTNKYFVNAVDSLNKEQEGVINFIKHMSGDNASERAIKKGMGILGQTGSKELENIIMKKVVQRSLDADTKTLNLAKFSQAMNALKQSNQSIIAHDSLQALDGLLKYVVQPNVAAQGNKSLGPIIGTGLGMGMGAGAYAAASSVGTPVLVGLTAAPILSAAISRNSPIKRALSFLNSMEREDNPNMYTHILKVVNQQLLRAKIYTTQQEDGSIKLDHEEENK